MRTETIAQMEKVKTALLEEMRRENARAELIQRLIAALRSVVKPGMIPNATHWKKAAALTTADDQEGFEFLRTYRERYDDTNSCPRVTLQWPASMRWPDANGRTTPGWFDSSPFPDQKGPNTPFDQYVRDLQRSDSSDYAQKYAKEIATLPEVFEALERLHEAQKALDATATDNSGITHPLRGAETGHNQCSRTSCTNFLTRWYRWLCKTQRVRIASALRRYPSVRWWTGARTAAIGALPRKRSLLAQMVGRNTRALGARMIWGRPDDLPA